MDHTSQTVKLRAEDLLAQVLEHEVDHLNGILYSDHLKDHQQLTRVPPEPESEDGASDHPGQAASVASVAEDRDEVTASLTVR